MTDVAVALPVEDWRAVYSLRGAGTYLRPLASQFLGDADVRVSLPAAAWKDLVDQARLALMNKLIGGSPGQLVEPAQKALDKLIAELERQGLTGWKAG